MYMIYNLDGIDYEVVIERKNNKHIYIRVKEDMKIHVSCSRLATKLMIKHILDENIKSPILKIRNMKTRWGVYNRANHTITLNAKLIEFDYEKIDYVIIHELSHIKHFDHSKAFWDLVGKYCKNYKQIRKEMKD